jgi:hypothetical protein
MTEYSFALPILPGKTDAWRKAVAEMNGPRWDEYKKSRKSLDIKREQACLQHTPLGDTVVIHMEAKDPAAVMPAMMAGVSQFDFWFRETVLLGVHGVNPKGSPIPPTEVVLDFKD